MGNLLGTHWRSAVIFGFFIIFIIGSAVGSTQAWAHRGFFNAILQTGAGSLAQEAISGQYGFNEASPFFIYGELDHQFFYYGREDNAVRALGEAGYESTHLGLSLRGGYTTGALQGLTASQFGGTLFYRFARWSLLTTSEQMHLKREERRAIIDRNKREINEDIPKASLLALTFDRYSVSSGASLLSAIHPTRMGGYLRATFEPFWTFIPSFTYFTYDLLPSLDPAGSAAYSSRALRLVRIGPQGQYSGIFGSPTTTAQIYSEIKLFPLLQIDAAITRVDLDSPSYVGYSFWIGFDRFLSPDKRWAISPAYEHYIQGGQSNSYFTIGLRYGAASQYLPPSE